MKSERTVPTFCIIRFGQIFNPRELYGEKNRREGFKND